MPLCAACGDDHPDGNSLCPRTGEVTTQGPCGSRIDRYEVERWIGGGGMGAVYLARHTMLQHRVALKLLHPSIAQRGDILERFLREARATASLGSKHIVKVYDCAVTPEGTAFIAMEALEGETLQGLLDRETRVDPARAVGIIRQVLEGIAEAHAAGIVHRDMKPGNVFLTPAPGGRGEERATILDFGISKIRTSNAAALTQTGTVMGTPHYMAPEQIWNSKDIDHRADIYAVGVMLYELVSGRLPFDAGSTAELLVKACTTDPIPLGALHLPLPPALVSAVERSMARDPDRRFGSAADFADALRGALAAAAPPPAPPPPPPPAGLAPSAPMILYGAAPQPRAMPHFAQPPPVFATPAPSPQPRRTLWIVLLVGLAVSALVCGGTVAFLLLDDRPSRRSSDAGAPGLVPLGGPQQSTENVAPQTNAITLHPGPGGVTLRPTTGGIQLQHDWSDAAVMIPIDNIGE